MSKEEIIDSVKECIINTIEDDLLVNLNDISNNDSLLNYGLNSLNVIKIIIEIEEQFSIMLEDEDIALRNWETLNMIAQLLERRL